MSSAEACPVGVASAPSPHRVLASTALWHRIRATTVPRGRGALQSTPKRPVCVLTHYLSTSARLLLPSRSTCIALMPGEPAVNVSGFPSKMELALEHAWRLGAVGTRRYRRANHVAPNAQAARQPRRKGRHHSGIAVSSIARGSRRTDIGRIYTTRSPGYLVPWDRVRPY